MGLIAKSTGKDFDPAPEGVHVARCYRIIDLGTQQGSYQGKPKVAHKIMVNWELSETAQDDGKPFIVGQMYTLSLGDKAQLRKDLQSWRGRPFTPEELEGFDIGKLLGAPCMLNIIHEVKDGKTHANISSIMPLPGKLVAPPLVNDKVFYSIADHDQAIFEKLSDYFKGKITSSPEYKEMQAESGGGQKQPANAGGVEDDDIPF